MTRRAFTLAIAILCASIGWGCHKFVPVETDASIQRGTGVLVHLAQPTDIQLEAVTANRVVTIEGEMIGWRGETLGVSAFRLVSETGFENESWGRTVEIPRSNVAGLEREEIDTARSIGVAAGFIGAAAAVAIILGEGGGGGGDEPDGPGGPIQ
ncbi:MAG: hypothetical protein R3199_04310 [Gemmatimonadota bacterium]|nr:hypothetical protein [Gemmatimonadota bacterium]